MNSQIDLILIGIALLTFVTKQLFSPLLFVFIGVVILGAIAYFLVKWVKEIRQSIQIEQEFEKKLKSIESKFISK